MQLSNFRSMIFLMEPIRKLAALVAATAIALTLGTAPAHADDSTPVVTASDLDITANTCFPTLVQVHTTPRDGSDYIVATFGPNGFVPGGSTTWPASATADLVLGFCAADLPQGHYIVQVDGVERGSFNAYRPSLDIVVPPAARVAAGRRVVSRLSIRGNVLAGRTVVAHVRYAGRTHTATRVTNWAGKARVRCPKGHACRVWFTYDNLAASRVIRVHR